jgi:hypothetical protein
MAPFRILSLDGGGIRGIFAIRILARLEQAVPGLLERTDLISGTSTGGILALGLAAGLTPDELLALYRDNGPRIFDDSWLDNLKDLGNIVGAQYDNSGLKQLLSERFRQRNITTLNDLRKRVLIASFDLDDGADPRRKPEKPRSWKPKFFHNYPGPDSDGSELAVDVAMRTSAAPTYFPSYGRFIDGGVIANNPAMAALALALNPQTGNQNLSDICLLSIGTGYNPTFVAGKDHDWGLAQWAKPLISILFDGAMGLVDYQCRQILDSRYARVNCVLNQVIPLDDYRQADLLVQLADRYDLTETIAWARYYFGPPPGAVLGEEALPPAPPPPVSGELSGMPGGAGLPRPPKAGGKGKRRQ